MYNGDDLGCAALIAFLLGMATIGLIVCIQDLFHGDRDDDE